MINATNVDALQAYYSEKKEGFYRRTFVNPMLSNMIMVSADDKLDLFSSNSTAGLQSFQSGHHSKGSIDFTVRRLEMVDVKFDMTFETKQFSRDSYFADWHRRNIDPKNYPFEAHVLNTMLSQLYEDYALNTMWGGIKLGPISGAPNNPGDVADGYRKLVHDGIAAGEIAPYLTGILDNTTALDGIEQFVEDQLDTPEKIKRPHYIFCSQYLVNAYRRNYKDVHGTYIHAENANTMTQVDGTNVTLIPQAGLSGSAMLMVRPDNLHAGFNGPPVFNMKYEHRKLYVDIDWALAHQYQSAIELYCNEWF